MISRDHGVARGDFERGAATQLLRALPPLAALRLGLGGCEDLERRSRTLSSDPNRVRNPKRSRQTKANNHVEGFIFCGFLAPWQRNRPKEAILEPYSFLINAGL